MQRLNIQQGATYKASFIFKVNGTPPDLTGFNATLVMRKLRNDRSDVLIEATTGSGAIVISNGTDSNGDPAAILDLTLSSVETADLPSGTVEFDLDASDQSTPPIVYRVATGQATVAPQV